MKIVQTSIIAGLAFFLSVGISFGADLDDIDFTIRVVESDDVGEMHNELSLPDMFFDVTHEHEGDANRENQESGTGEHEFDADARDEREDDVEDHDEAREDNDDVNDEYDEAHDSDHEDEHEHEHGEAHEAEHEKEDN
ncbi:MAG: hypothetical protein L3K25_02775 [Gammaproteobacteria bacterium]|nr:hypothetical protein [Gammaproteobacteria bacterium]